MCVIIVKKQGVLLPTYETLKAAYNKNPHGAGYAAHNKNGFISYKSMNFNDFYSHFCRNVTAGDDAIIHFRLATHGSRNVNNCHPFANAEKNLFFAHNGILNFTSVNDLTDSEIAFRAILEPTAARFGLRSKTFKEVVNQIISGSKFAFLDSEGVKTFGNFEKYNGLLCSNLYFLGSNYWYYGNYGYRSDAFYNSIFTEHNEPYKRKKFAF